MTDLKRQRLLEMKMLSKRRSRRRIGNRVKMSWKKTRMM